LPTQALLTDKMVLRSRLIHGHLWDKECGEQTSNMVRGPICPFNVRSAISYIPSAHLSKRNQ
jgi:hypothetical protein